MEYYSITNYDSAAWYNGVCSPGIYTITHVTLADASGKISGWLILWKCQQQSQDWTERTEKVLLTARNTPERYNSEKWTKIAVILAELYWLSGRKVCTLTKEKETICNVSLKNKSCKKKAFRNTGNKLISVVFIWNKCSHSSEEKVRFLGKKITFKASHHI